MYTDIAQYYVMMPKSSPVIL